MTEAVPDITTLLLVLAGALVAGFTTGFAGFGTGLVASGLWFHVLPAPIVPPLVALASVAAQLVGLFAVRKAFAWRGVAPYLAGAVVGVPLGVWLLSVASPAVLRLSVAAFLVAYALSQLNGLARVSARKPFVRLCSSCCSVRVSSSSASPLRGEAVYPPHRTVIGP